jgi:hypothetical protein
MLARRREQILIVAGLIGVNILLGWFLARLWKDYRRRTQWLYVGASAQPSATPAPGPNKEGGPPQSFVEIVDRNVFSPLRGSPPPKPPEEAKAPKPPVLFGTMNLGDGWFALMAPGDKSSPVSQRVQPGEEIGGYKLVSIGTSNVVIQWQEKKTTLEVTGSAPQVPGVIEKTASPGARSAQVTTAGSAPRSATITSSSLGGAASNSAAQSSPPPDVPAGTIIGGKRKVVLETPFGTKAYWVDVGTPGSEPPNQTSSPNK